MIILFYFSFTIFIFSVVSVICNKISKIEKANKVESFINKRNNKNILKFFIFNISSKLGNLFRYIKNKKFLNYISKIESNLYSINSDTKAVDTYSFFASQILSAISGVLICAVFISRNIFIVILIALLFFFLPLIKIKEQLKKRKELVLKQIPDVADLLSIMLAAGLDFYRASDKIVNILEGPLIFDFKDALSKISLGYDKTIAFAEMTAKTDIRELSFFIRVINTSLDSGCGMAESLKRLSSSLRQDIYFHAEKKAHQAPIRILIPLILLIFPTIFIVIFGPIAINFLSFGA
ncbi:MAG: type II secretion system F family protein [Endomicrobium sp.]|jgi:tight adherence protein C|nr:type II secretion system F family protein [Endomicrobium sp.]